MSDFNEPSSGPSVPPPHYGDAAAVGTSRTTEERQWGMFAHVAAVLGLILPFGNIIGPLILWLMKKDTMPFVDDQGKEALNFQITVTIAMLIAGASMIVLIGFLLLPAVAIAALVLTVMAAIKANEGVAYRYPFTLRLIK
ncbi:DUF4870 domain-containing protein [Lysobacter humi (ex Lee et al. 2017)]